MKFFIRLIVGVCLLGGLALFGLLYMSSQIVPNTQNVEKKIELKLD